MIEQVVMKETPKMITVMPVHIQEILIIKIQGNSKTE